MTKPTQQELLEYLSYDPITGIVTWIKSKSKRNRVGDIAGSKATPGHLQIKFNGVSLQLHNVIWCMVHGYWPDLLDHKDTNKTNNKLFNLREATSCQNAANRNVRVDCLSKFKGVSKHASKWRARIYINDKNISLGSFDTMEQAAKAYDNAAIATFGDFALTNKKLGLII